MVSPAVIPAASATTHARSAEALPIQPLPVPSSFTPVVTPLVAAEWEAELRHANMYIQYAHVPYGIRHGFDMGVHTIPTLSYTPPNHKSALLHPSVIHNHILSERSLGRYTGPFSKSRLEHLLGPFRSAPLGTIEKAGSTDELRIIQDFSYPRNTNVVASVNSDINMEDFRCDWGTFNEIVSIVIEVPPSTTAATLDVDAAYRRCPI